MYFLRKNGDENLNNQGSKILNSIETIEFDIANNGVGNDFSPPLPS